MEHRPNDCGGVSPTAGCLATGILLIAAFAVFLYCAEQRNERLGGNFALVRPGMSNSEVKEIMGPPSWEGTCDSFGAGVPSARCFREIGYRSWYAPVLPTYWVIEFDERGRATEPKFLVSP